MQYVPKQYQAKASAFAYEKKRCALHIDMGLGKTAAVLEVCRRVLDNFESKGILVIAPVRVATITWPAEIKKWDCFKHLRYANVRGSPASREIRRKGKTIYTKPSEGALKALSSGTDIYLANYEIIDGLYEWIVEHLEDLPFDTLVLDESSKMKSPSSQRFKTFKSICASARIFKRIIEMTGTPAPEHYENLWSQYYLLDKGTRLLPYISHFRSRYFETNPWNKYEINLRPGADKEIQKKIADITLTLRGEDWLELPKIIENDIIIDLPEAVRERYKVLKTEMVDEINEQPMVNAAMVSEKCRQLVSGFIYRSDKSVEQVHDKKWDALDELIEGIDEPLLVAYWYRQEAEVIKKRYPKAPILGEGLSDKRATQLVEQWNKRKIPLLFIHPASVGHGLNLQEGGRHLVYLTLPWSNETYSQTVKRIHRMGQSKPVMVHRILTDRTVDTTVLAALNDKEFTQQALLKALCTTAEGF